MSTPLLRSLWLPGLLLFCVLGLLVFPAPVGGAEPMPAPQAQKDRFNSILARLKTHKTSMPTPVDAVIESLTKTVTRMFPCPNGSAVNQVTVNITTTIIKWDTKLSVAGKAAGVPVGAAGFYYWNVPKPVIANGQKTITAMNYIMLDPRATATKETEMPFGPLANEALLYHELLHGQLVIDAIATADWQQKACNCTTDLSARDAGHSVIPAKEDAFITNLAGPDADITIVRTQAQKAKDASGNFEVEIGPLTLLKGKEQFSWVFHFLDGSNVVELGPGAPTIVEKGGKLFVTGRLVDKSKPGAFLVHIDPPLLALLVGTEIGIVVLPSDAARIPTLAIWAMLLLSVLLGVLARRYIRRP